MPRIDHNAKKLLPYETIAAACAGDPDALADVLKHFDGFISLLATRQFRDAHQTTYSAVDHELKERLQLKLIASIVKNFDTSPR